MWPMTVCELCAYMTDLIADCEQEQKSGSIRVSERDRCVCVWQEPGETVTVVLIPRPVKEKSVCAHSNNQCLNWTIWTELFANV